MANDEAGGCFLVIVGLAIAGVILYLYYLLIRWMFTSVAPYMIALLSVIGILVVLVMYSKTILRIFGMGADDESIGLSKSAVFGKGWKIILWIPIFALLFFIYCDFAFLVLVYLGKVSSKMWKFIPLFSHLVISNYGLYGLLITLAIKSALLVPILIIIRGMATNIEDGKQPAKIQYFFSQALSDLKNVVVWTSKDIARIVITMYDKSEFKYWDWSVAGWILAFTWPLALSLLLSLAVILLVAVAIMGVIGTLHSIGVIIVFSFSMYFAGMFHIAEKVLILIRSGYVRCPHAGCYASIALPVFICPKCKSPHDKLIPGKYGVFKRTCTCGHKLSTLYWLGKGELIKICPSCKKPLSDDLFSGNVHLPIYGGSSVGKTMFRMATAWQLLEGKLKEINASLIDEVDRQQYKGTWKPDFEKGNVREKTQEKIPSAFLIKLKRESGLPISLYMYDPAGESMTDEVELQGHKFLKYFDGLALLIDPLTLPSMARIYESKTGKLPDNASLDDPREMINYIVNVLENMAKLTRGKKFNRRIAIIITKADDPIIQEELGLKLSSKVSEDDWSDMGYSQSKKIQKWLSKNEPDLYQQINTRFGDIRFFAVSSLGHAPEEDKAFKPKQVLNPICWLLSKRRVLSHPKLTRLTMQIAEFSAVCATYLIFIGGLVTAGIVIASMQF